MTQNTFLVLYIMRVRRVSIYQRPIDRTIISKVHGYNSQQQHSELDIKEKKKHLQI